MSTNLKNVLKVISGILVFAVIIFVIYLIYLSTNYYFGISDSDLNSYKTDVIDGFNDAQKFIDYGYPQIKELTIQYLTFLSSILVFSVTFSEKIINFSTAKSYTKTIIIFGWAFIVVAITLGGIGLAYNVFALPFALADVYTIEHEKIDSIDFYIPAFKSLFAILVSGFFFILGLVCIVITGILSIFKK